MFFGRKIPEKDYKQEFKKVLVELVEFQTQQRPTFLQVRKFERLMNELKNKYWFILYHMCMRKLESECCCSEYSEDDYNSFDIMVIVITPKRNFYELFAAGFFSILFYKASTYLLGY